VEKSAKAILSALTMTPEERARQVQALRTVVKEHDLYWWLDTFLEEWGIEVNSRDCKERPPPDPVTLLPTKRVICPPPS
jgi:trehalose-6-phosphate synthase